MMTAGGLGANKRRMLARGGMVSRVAQIFQIAFEFFRRFRNQFSVSVPTKLLEGKKQSKLLRGYP
jgi:hypothetical protein